MSFGFNLKPSEYKSELYFEFLVFWLSAFTIRLWLLSEAAKNSTNIHF